MPAFILNQPATRHPANLPAGEVYPEIYRGWIHHR